MASTADVTFALLQRSEQRKLEESARQAQQDTQKRSSKMGLGRLIGTIGGSLLGLALAPVTGGASLFVTAGLAGLGSRAGSEWGQQTTNIRETDVNKQKLYRDTASDLRDDQFEAQRDLNRLANVRGLTDAFSVFSMGATAGGQAVMQGAQAAGIQGAWQGGKAYAKSKLASLVGKSTTDFTRAPAELLKPDVSGMKINEALQMPAELTPAGVPTPPMLSTGDISKTLGFGNIEAAGFSTGTGAGPLAGVDKTRMSYDEFDVMNFANRKPDIPGTGTVSVDQLFNRRKPIGGVNTGRIASGAGRSSGIWSNPSGAPPQLFNRAPLGSSPHAYGPASGSPAFLPGAAPVRSTVLQSAVEQSLPTAKKFAGSATQNKTLATTMGFNPNESLIKQMKKLGIDSSFSNREGMWNQYLSGNIVSGTGAFPNTIPQSSYYGPLTPRR
jgi:hypothetical protein